MGQYYFEQLYSNKFNNLDEMDQSFVKHTLQKLIQE